MVWVQRMGGTLPDAVSGSKWQNLLPGSLGSCSWWSVPVLPARLSNRCSTQVCVWTHTVTRWWCCVAVQAQQCHMCQQHSGLSWCKQSVCVAVHTLHQPDRYRLGSCSGCSMCDVVGCCMTQPLLQDCSLWANKGAHTGAALCARTRQYHWLCWLNPIIFCSCSRIQLKPCSRILSKHHVKWSLWADDRLHAWPHIQKARV